MTAQSHDQLGYSSGQQILSGIRNEKDRWKQIFSPNSTRIGWTGWPQPDYVIKDHDKDVTYAIEFKPPNKDKREYMTGLGQSLGYLSAHNYSCLVVPEKSNDNYLIGQFIKNLLEKTELNNIQMSLFSYDEKKLENNEQDSLKLLHSIERERVDKPLTQKGNTEPIFWCWWRDNSNFEIFELLKLSDQYNKHSGDIYTDYIWPKFWEMLINEKSKTWEGKYRIIKKSSETQHKQNWKIPLNQLGLWNPSNGRLTLLGHKLLSFGKVYGCESSEFIFYLRFLVLNQGKHLQLIHEIERFQNESQNKKSLLNAKIFVKDFDKYLINNGIVPPPPERKPGRKTTGGKMTYVRDEFKLWNKLGLLKTYKNKRIFHPGIGYKFSITVLTETLRKNFSF